MTDVIIRRRGSIVYIHGQTVAGDKWIKANMWNGRGESIVTIQLEYLEYWILEMVRAELIYEYN